MKLQRSHRRRNYPFVDETSTAARSRGKLLALRSCITSIPTRLMISAQVLMTRPCPIQQRNYRLVEIETTHGAVESHSANTAPWVNQIPITGQAAKKKCKERELLKLEKL